MYTTAILVPYKMEASMWKLYTFWYGIRNSAHRDKGSVGANTPILNLEWGSDEMGRVLGLRFAKWL